MFRVGQKIRELAAHASLRSNYSIVLNYIEYAQRHVRDPQHHPPSRPPRSALTPLHPVSVLPPQLLLLDLSPLFRADQRPLSPSSLLPSLPIRLSRPLVPPSHAYTRITYRPRPNPTRCSWPRGLCREPRIRESVAWRYSGWAGEGERGRGGV